MTKWSRHSRLIEPIRRSVPPPPPARAPIPFEAMSVIPSCARLPENPFAISRDRLAELDALAHRRGIALKTVAVRKAPRLLLGQQFYNHHPGHAFGRILRRHLTGRVIFSGAFKIGRSRLEDLRPSVLPCDGNRALDNVAKPGPLVSMGWDLRARLQLQQGQLHNAVTRR